MSKSTKKKVNQKATNKSTNKLFEENHTIYAMIFCEQETKVAKIALSGKLSALDNESIKQLCSWLAEVDDEWNEVLKGTKSALLFDSDSLETMRINTGN